MLISDTKKGDLAIIVHAILWGLFPVVTVLVYSALNVFTALFFTTLLAVAFFAIWLAKAGKWGELKSITVWLESLRIALILGVLLYSLYFLGLRFTTPGNAALVGLMEAFFSFLFFNVWKKEYLSSRHIIGAACMLSGALLVVTPKAGSVSSGDFLVLAATVCAPLGNFYQQKLRQKVSSETIMFARGILTLPFVLILGLIFSQPVSFINVFSVWPLLLVNGLLLLGFAKILWLEGIHRISVTKAVSIGSLAPLCTLIFAYIFLGQIPTMVQLAAFAPLAVGLYLLTADANAPEIV